MHTNFYGKLYAQDYDAGTEIGEVTAYYLDHWQQFGRPNPVLEPMCGTGIHLLPFLQAGADIDGLDSSPYMLNLCRQKLASQNLAAELYQQPIESMALSRQYAFVFIPDGSFGHLYELATARQCLAAAYQHVLPNGYLMFDVKSLSQLGNFPSEGQSSMKVYDRSDGSTIFETTVWGAVADGSIIRCWNKIERYVEGKLVETEIFDYRERLYDRDALESLLKEVGFTVEAVRKPYEKVEPQQGSGFVFICRK